MIDFVDMLDQPGQSLDDASDDPAVHRHQRSPLWSAVAMVGIISAGGVVSDYSSSYADQVPAPSVTRVLSGSQVVELCRDEMLNLGIRSYSVPAYVPDGDGSNVQAQQPWRSGTTVKVVPDRGRGGPDGATSTVSCTIPAN